MKSKLLLLFAFIAFATYAQSPINEFTSAANSEYAVVNSAPAIDQSATGANLTWTFNNLSATGTTNSDSTGAPTSGQSTTYPGTTTVLTITPAPSGDASNLFIKDNSGEVSLTGLSQGAIILNYNTDNALIGTLPLNYGYTNTDTTAGTYEYPDAPVTILNRTFTGTIEASVDAYGTLTMNDVGAGSTTSTVTRLKTIQNIVISGDIDFGFTTIPITGTVDITSYNYYKSDGDLVFRTVETIIDVPDASVNDTSIVMESLIDSILVVEESRITENNIKIFPNVVENELNIQLSNGLNILSVEIYDVQGRKMISANENNISVDVLTTGIYYASIITDGGKVTKKFVKK